MIHAFRRERLLVLSCGLPSNLLKILLLARWETIDSLLSQFSIHQPPNMFQQKPDGRLPHSTDRRVSTAHQERVGAPNELAMFRFHDTVVDFAERSVRSTRNYAASTSKIFLTIPQADVSQDRCKKSFFSGKLECSTKTFHNFWAQR